MPHSLGSLESSEQLIRELYIELRRKINNWASITKQTAQARMGYIGQHLVSVVTGFPGGRSGARGKDLVLPNNQFAEIKTCYRVDQLGKCEDCGAPVSSIELECPACNSAKVKRNDDSKWLIGVQHEEEFSEVLSPKFYFLVLFDFTDLARPDTIRASIWRINPLVPGFAYCIVDYYKNIKSASASGAPFNLWPFQLKFELMRPELIYQALILPDDTINTQRFPGRDPEAKHPLSPLTSFARSRNLTTDKIRAFAGDLNLTIPRTEHRLTLLTAAQDAIARSNISQEAIVDYLAKRLYWPDVERHVQSLPTTLANRMREARLI